jgi:exonuclease III
MSNLLSILSWNVRGLNTPVRREAARSMITQAQPKIGCLQEIKMPSFTPQLLAETMGSRIDKYSLLPAQGTRGWGSPSLGF